MLTERHPSATLRRGNRRYAGGPDGTREDDRVGRQRLPNKPPQVLVGRQALPVARCQYFLANLVWFRSRCSACARGRWTTSRARLADSSPDDRRGNCGAHHTSEEQRLSSLLLGVHSA